MLLGTLVIKCNVQLNLRMKCNNISKSEHRTYCVSIGVSGWLNNIESTRHSRFFFLSLQQHYVLYCSVSRLDTLTSLTKLSKKWKVIVHHVCMVFKDFVGVSFNEVSVSSHTRMHIKLMNFDFNRLNHH